MLASLPGCGIRGRPVVSPAFAGSTTGYRLQSLRDWCRWIRATSLSRPLRAEGHGALPWAVILRPVGTGNGIGGQAVRARILRPERASHDSPGQGPGSRSIYLSSSLERAAQPLLGTGGPPRLGRPFRARKYRVAGVPGPCPGLSWVAPLGLESLKTQSRCERVG